MSSIALPPCSYPAHETLGAAIDSGALSRLQLEGVAYACQKHLERLPDGVHRAGFMIGDGAGVGKGRQISGIVLDNFARGRVRHVWVSSSRDLKRDAERDLADLGCAGLRVIDGVKELERETRAVGLSKSCAEGVLFVTYSALVSKGGGGKSRLEQVLEWFAGGEPPTPDAAGSGAEPAGAPRDVSRSRPTRETRERNASGCLIFDECHKAKNFNAGADAGSKVASCVIELQRRLPNARVVYCSATGVSEVGNMAYMRRLGFWGRGTPFADARSFIDAMKHRGVGFLEMLAMEMKASGKYVSRGLSFRQAEFCAVETRLDAKQRAAYDACADFVAKLKACLSQALIETRSGATRTSATWKAYWSMHQRLFKLLCVSAKVPEVVRHAKAALARGQCVVVGMQTTGESAEACEAETGMVRFAERGPVPGFVSTTRAMLRAFVEAHFPTHVVDVAARAAGTGPEAASADGTFDAKERENGVSSRGVPLRPHPECVEAKGILLDLIDGLDLPPNALDELIDELGGPTAVAEMTGRRWRVVRRGGRLRREPRAGNDPSADAADGVNIAEKRAFQSGEKLVAVISDAASTGISLHARVGEGNDRRRVHVTIELPWSADKAIQQLGRTHRSNQTSGPSYVMVSTNLGGERRFAAAVARRLQSLGALTRGDRRAATGIDLSEGHLDSPLGRQALKKMYDALVLRGAGKRGLANGVSLEDVLAHLPERTDRAADAADAAAQAPAPEEPDASAYLFAEASSPGAGTAALHDELRACVVSLGVQVGLTPVGLTDQQRLTLAETGAGSKDNADVRRFLNRALGLPTRAQNLLFGYFLETLRAETRAAKAEGRYTEGVSDLSGSDVVIESSDVLVRDPFGSAGAELRKTVVAIDRGVGFAEARRALARHARLFGGLRARDGFYRMRREMYGRTQVILALTKPGTRNTFAVTRPNTGASFFEMELEDLDAKYVKVETSETWSSDVARDGDEKRIGEVGDEGREDENTRRLRLAWTETYDLTEFGCMHGSVCTSETCRIGTRKVRCCIVSGAVVPSWGVLEKVLERHADRFPRSDRGMRAARVVAEDGTKVVGIRYPEELLEEVRDKLVQEWAARDDAERRRDSGDADCSSSGLGLSADAVTPVDARCARRAATAPKTMRSFFQTGTHAPEFEIGNERGRESEPEARKRSKNEDSRKSLTSGFFAPKARQRQTCPICQHVFPASSLNSDVNTHVDRCVERAGS